MQGLIIGFGQDAKLLSIGLKKKGIDFKILVKPATIVTPFVSDFIDKGHLLYGDATDLSCLLKVCKKHQFTHIYNVAGNTLSQTSKMNFYQYLNSNTQILTNILSVQENVGNLWIYHPLSSEILSGNPQKTLIYPRNAYGVSKTTEYYISNIANSNGVSIFYPILFNHESCFRPKKFFSAKLIYFLKENNQRVLEIWNTNSCRDWGSASQYMNLILLASMKNKTGGGQLGTSKTQTIAEFVNSVLRYLKIKYKAGQTKNRLRYWKLDDGREIIEKERDVNDASRIVMADQRQVNKTFGKYKLIHGEELVHLLFKEYDLIQKNEYLKIVR